MDTKTDAQLRKQFAEAAGDYLREPGFRHLVWGLWFESPHVAWELYSEDAIKRAEECARLLNEHGNVSMYRLGTWLNAV